MSTPVEILDVLLRFSAVGQLLLIAIFLLRSRPPTANGVLLFLLCPCVAAYLLLTAPPSVAFDAIRGPLLVLTHAAPYLLWLLGMGLFDRRTNVGRWPRWVWVPIAMFSLWHIYFFGLLRGIGLFHDISHAVFIVMFGHLVFLAIRGMADDLVEARRKARVLLLAVISAQLLLVTAFELTGASVADNALVSGINAGLFLVIVSVVALHVFGPSGPEILEDEDPSRLLLRAEPNIDAVPAADRGLYRDLMRFMADGGYRQTNLSVGSLAETLSSREHLLRRLINQQLGYRNFSSFLNDHRIEEACERLSDIEQARIPVLTIALELGFGSIGPFNRAFKAKLGQTPSEYRKSRLT